jgi:hypothetical protein
MTIRFRRSWVALSLLSAITAAGCSSHTSPTPHAASRPITDLVLTTALMPASMTGWTAVATGTDPDIALKQAMANPHRSPRPAAEASCDDLDVDTVADIVEVPLDESGATVTAPATGTPWKATERVFRYDGGVAKATLDTIRGLTGRCATQGTVKIVISTGPDLGDDSLTLQRNADAPAYNLGDDEYSIIIRSGDDLIMVEQHLYNDTIVTSKVWTAATAAYGAYTRT